MIFNEYTKDQWALLNTLNIFNVYQDQELEKDIMLSSKWGKCSPYASWGELLETNPIDKLLEPVDMYEDEDDRHLATVLNKHILEDSKNKDIIIFDTFLKFYYEILYNEEPIRLYSNFYSTSDDISLEYRAEPLNAGQYALAAVINIGLGFKIEDSANTIIANFKTNLNGREKYYFISDFIESDDEEMHVYLNDLFKEIIMKYNKETKYQGMLLFNLIYDIYLDLYSFQYPSRTEYLH